MVGVPDLLRWELGPSSLINSDKLLIENLFIIYGPNNNEIKRAVIILNMALKVMYSKTKKLEL
jgi:hypothetical protein